MLNVQFLKYLIVGGGNALFGYSVFVLFVYSGMQYSLAVLFSTLIGVLFNFKSTGTIVFGNKNNRRILRFIAVYCFVYVINVLGIKFLRDYGLNTYVSGAILLFPLAVFSFVLNTLYVFREGAK